MGRLIMAFSIITVVIFGIVGISAHSSAYQYNYALDLEKAIQGGNIIEAEYTGMFEIHSRIGSSSSVSYALYYEFTYQGKTYKEKGYALIFNYSDKAKVESYIGQKVDIYIGENGVSIIVGEEPNINGSLTVFIVCVAILTVWILIVAAIFSWLGYHRRKNRKNQETEQETEDVKNLSGE